jgi:hypothetical protein
MCAGVREIWRNDKYRRRRVRVHINAVDKKRKREGERKNEIDRAEERVMADNK